MNRFLRWFVNTGMSRGIPDKKTLEYTLTLYRLFIYKETFKQSLRITDEKKGDKGKPIGTRDITNQTFSEKPGYGPRGKLPSASGYGVP